MHPSRGSRPARPLALTVLVGVVILSACAGENLFSLAAAVGAVGPEVSITAPSEGLTLAAGAPLVIVADATSSDGISSAKFSGVFKESDEAAFVQVIDNFQNPTFVNLAKTLEAVEGAGTGSVYVIVEVTDRLGVVTADSVSITVS